MKSIRIRRPADAAYWLMYLNSPRFGDSQSRFRVARRLLQATAEDGFAIPVMETCAAHFKKLCQLDTPLIHYVADALRCCKEPNWWHPATNGREYIYMWLVGWRRALYEQCFDAQEGLDKMTAAILARDKIEAAKWWYLLQGTKRKPGTTAQVQWVQSIARKAGHADAMRLCDVHLSLRTPLSVDSNFVGEAIWYLCGGECPTAYDAEPVSAEECQPLIDAAAARWRHPEPIPAWCCDGIHCAGNDTRFAGILTSSMATCNAFEHYGRVDPADEWLPQFQCHDGLIIARE